MGNIPRTFTHVLCSALVSVLSFAVGCQSGPDADAPVTSTQDAMSALTFYASPTGSGTTCSLAAPCSLAGAQAMVRAQTTTIQSDIVVNLLGGTYTLTQPWTFSVAQGDSSANGFKVIYQANGYGTPGAEKPVISGGRTITGWTLHDSTRNIWKANVGSLQTRQLYVNYVRAFRARQSTGIPGTVTRTSTGYTTTSTLPQTWRNPADVELVFHDGTTDGNWLWAQPRCPVASISGTSTSSTITVAQPCFDSVVTYRGNVPSPPTWVENAYQFLTKPGTFYLDRSVANAHVLYYIPRTGETLSSATVIAPVLEKLVDGQGTFTSPLRGLQFKGLTFAYATWLGPSQPLGFPEASYNKYANGSGGEVQQPANVTFFATRDLLLEGNTFVHLGGAGLTLDSGSRNNAVVGCVFNDISGQGIQIGNITSNGYGPELVTDNLVSNNYVHHIGAEYPGAVGLWNAYSQNTTVIHNVFAHLPRGGIASNYGYSWGLTVGSGNRFLYNLVYDYMNGIRDGGGFDTNGSGNGMDGIHPNNILEGNVFRDDHNNYGQIYLDIWTSGLTLENNLAFRSASLDYNTINGPNQPIEPCCNIHRRNFYDQDNSFKYIVAADMVVGNGVLGVAAMPGTILQRAGLEPAWRHLDPPPVPSDTQAPTAPYLNIGALSAGPSLGVSWFGGSDNVGITGFEVDDGTTVVAATPNTSTSATIVGLHPGMTYSLRMRSRDAAGNVSPGSNVQLVNVPGSADLLGHWTFDEGAGASAADSSGSGNTGTVTGAAWGAGKVGGALVLSGAQGSKVAVGNPHVLNLDRQSFTLTAWFKSTATGWRRMVTKGNWGDTAGYMLQYSSGAVAFGIGSRGQKDQSSLAFTPASFNDGAWHHVAAVANRAAQTLQIYVDGVAQPLTADIGFCGTASGTTLSIAACPYLAASSASPFFIGSHDGYEVFSGSLDDVRVYGRALSAAELPDVMSLAGRFAMDELAGTGVVDSTGNSRTATASNVTRIQGRVGGGLSFNGTNSSVSAGNAGALNMGGESFTFSTWFNSTSTARQRIVSKGNWGNSSGYMMWYNAGGITFSLGSDGVQANTALAGTPGGFGDGKWHLATAVVNRAAATIQIYVDGVAQTLTSGTGYCGTATGTTLSIAGCTRLNGTSADPFTLGSYNGQYEFFSGALDDARLYRRALSATEVSGLFQDSLVARFRFDEGNTDVVADSQRNSAGRAHRTRGVAGRFGGALDFQGLNSYVTVGNSDALNMGTGSFTLSTWLKTTATGWKRMVTKGHWANSAGYFFQYNSGSIVFGVGADGQAAHATVVGTPGGFNDGAWHLATAVVDRTAGTLQVYVDGLAQPLTQGAGTCGTVSGTSLSLAGCTLLNATTADPFSIGSYNGNEEYFEGALDDVRVYRRALSATEVSALLQGP
jgi:hypothetical protein